MNCRFFALIGLYIVGLLFFLNGFLLTRRVILQNSTGVFPPTIPVDFKQVVLIVIDALRYDFIKPHNTPVESNYQNQMPFVRQLLASQPKQSVLLRLLADPPTTTLQRLKALTTGTLPTFIDVSYNFIGYEIEEDNLLNQVRTGTHRRNVSLLGDDTWLALYPNVPFQHLHVYPSFDVHDLDTVDNGILAHIWRVIDDTRQQNSSFVVAHFLGVDHCGHRYGPMHAEMKRKLNQMDDFIRNLTVALTDPTSPSLLMVIGDHGMTQQGDHGGDELNEIETAMFLYTNQPNYFSVPTSKDRTVSQIDLVPTLSWFLHALVPFSNVGMMIVDLLPREQRYSAMKLNFEQMDAYLRQISLTLPLSDEVQSLRAELHSMLHKFEGEKHLPAVERLFEQFKVELQTHFRRQWSTFNISRIITGLTIMLGASLVLLLIYFDVHRSELFSVALAFMSFAISFSNSFIINEAMCLHFLIQTILLISRRGVLDKLLASSLLFLSRAFLICREEQQPHCVDPVWLLAKSSDSSEYFLPLISAITWAIILASASPLSYLTYLPVVAYWFNVPHSLPFFYISLVVQLGIVLYKRSRFDALIYSLLIFAVGYRFSLVIFLQYFIYRTLSTHTDHATPLLLSFLADYFFYASGHQPVLSQIRWTAAFPTLSSPLHAFFALFMNSLVMRGLLVLVETFSGQILNVIFIRRMLPTREQSTAFKRVLTIDCVKLLTTSFSVFLLRRHLMLWKIFSPRFLFQLVGFVIKCLFVFLTMVKLNE